MSLYLLTKATKIMIHENKELLFQFKLLILSFYLYMLKRINITLPLQCWVMCSDMKSSPSALFKPCPFFTYLHLFQHYLAFYTQRSHRRVERVGNHLHLAGFLSKHTVLGKIIFA